MRYQHTEKTAAIYNAMIKEYREISCDGDLEKAGLDYEDYRSSGFGLFLDCLRYDGVGVTDSQEYRRMGGEAWLPCKPERDKLDCKVAGGRRMKLEIEVKRRRPSVTQGEAEVYVNGEKVITFGDTIEIIKDGQPYYGEKVGSWASTKPDSDFIKGLLWHPYEQIYHYSEPVKRILEKGVEDERRY